jgi:hypothetical protein
MEERLEVAYIDSGAWKHQIVGANLPKIPYGYHLSLVRESDTLYRTLYEDRNVHQMWMASGRPGGEWTTEKLDSLDGYTNFSALSCLKLGKDGMPYIAYANLKSPDGYEVTSSKLVFAYKSGDTWYKQVLDSNGTVGEYASMAVDSKGQPAITYFDRERHQLKMIFGTFEELTPIKRGSRIRALPRPTAWKAYDAAGRVRSAAPRASRKAGPATPAFLRP